MFLQASVNPFTEGGGIGDHALASRTTKASGTRPTGMLSYYKTLFSSMNFT